MSTRPRRGLRMLLIQVRDHRAAAEQEVECFLARCRLAPFQLRVHNVVERPAISWPAAADVDAVMVGGAGSHSVTHDDVFTEPLTELMLRVLDEEVPFFGSCWGHQFLARALGGSVIVDHDSAEVGTFDIELTEAGRRDPLFETFPESFPVQLGHNDRVDALPPGVVELARSALCANQVIRVEGKPAYGSQFHSEMTREDMWLRVRMYRESYIGDGADSLAAFDSRLRPTLQADRLLDRFLEVYT